VGNDENSITLHEQALVSLDMPAQVVIDEGFSKIVRGRDLLGCRLEPVGSDLAAAEPSPERGGLVTHALTIDLKEGISPLIMVVRELEGPFIVGEVAGDPDFIIQFNKTLVSNVLIVKHAITIEDIGLEVANRSVTIFYM
jgi:hypothetical protein